MDKQERAARKKHHVIYKTTCLVTGRWYIGMHSTDDLNDGYIGSGKRLWQSIKKHGVDQHRCEVLEHLPSRQALREREAELVNEKLLENKQCMNLALGGEGGWERCNRLLRARPGHHQKAGYLGYLASVLSGGHATTSGWKHVDRKAIIATHRARGIGFFDPNVRTRATKRAAEPDVIARRKQTYANTCHQAGLKNSNYGMRWVNRDGHSLKVKDAELDSYLSQGWLLGKHKLPKQRIERIPASARWLAWIEERAAELLLEFDSHGSISKLLSSRGFVGREGNGYLSDWLKSQGRSVLKRRNSR